MKHLQFLLLSLSSIPFLLQAQEKTKHAFGDRLLLGAHYGFYEDYVDTRDNQYEAAHFVGMRAGVSMTKQLYAGIQTRLIWARNFETPTQNFYMAGVWARGYLLHPVLEKSTNRLGVFLETGFMLGNYAFENRNSVEYHFEQPGSWYVPNMLGVEFRVWRKLTLEGGMNLIFNNGGGWDQQGIAYLSLGANWHW